MIKKVLLIIGFVLGVIILILVLDIMKFYLVYQINRNKYQDTLLVQGNINHYVPQGLAYADKYDIILQTSYNSDHKVSMLYVTNFKTGKLLKKLKLKEVDKTDNLHHVGGIATDNSTVWITSDYQINEYSLEEILKTKNNYIQSKKNSTLKIRGDFCTFNNNILWIGDFCLKPFYPVPDDNPLLLAYNDKVIDYDKPDTIISLPKMVQGLTFDDKGDFIFTTSFTNLIASKLLIYDNILNDKTTSTYLFNGRDVPYYEFTNKHMIKKYELPPMAEGLFYKDKSCYILFENSSDTYWYALPKMKMIISLTV